ncbi:glycosyltransferase [Thermosulfurimonas sp. F29]|uniref:glycosyltransferase n=1 Tax=Thermosulfurimonas sp. F29 TaxID=2867247 RepID=UPI001C83EFE0|nr:glycosyltransferase [Thermosulfurimonas sp. F29]MBX6424243.1 glycosyltransferase [Thermosulfurimonas sp. F29]
MITAVVVNYHTEVLLRRLLSVLVRETIVDRILVVDNSDTMSAERFPKTAILKPGKNLGFARAVNLASREMSSPYLLVINPDVIPFPGSISHLLVTAQKFNCAIVGPRFYWDMQKRFRLPPAEGMSLFWKTARILAEIWPHEAELLSFYWRCRHERFWEATDPFWEPFLSGACLLIHREKLGGEEIFDSRYFLYYEDTDLCVKVRNEEKLFLCDPGAEMMHLWNQSPEPPEGKGRLMEKAETFFFLKHYGSPYPSFSFPAPSKPIMPEKSRYIEISAALPEEVRIPVPEPGYLEIGLNPYLVPFAQTEVRPPVFVFPEDPWRYMPPGDYYLRLYNRHGILLQRFRLKKS